MSTNRGTKYSSEQELRTSMSNHTILRVNTNGTVCLRIGAVTDTVNIRRIEPYKNSSDSNHGGYAICDTPRREEDEHMQVASSKMSNDII